MRRKVRLVVELALLAQSTVPFLLYLLRFLPSIEWIFFFGGKKRTSICKNARSMSVWLAMMTFSCFHFQANIAFFVPAKYANAMEMQSADMSRMKENVLQLQKIKRTWCHSFLLIGELNSSLKSEWRRNNSNEKSMTDPGFWIVCILEYER